CCVDRGTSLCSRIVLSSWVMYLQPGAHSCEISPTLCHGLRVGCLQLACGWIICYWWLGIQYDDSPGRRQMSAMVAALVATDPPPVVVGRRILPIRAVAWAVFLSSKAGRRRGASEF